MYINIKEMESCSNFTAISIVSFLYVQVGTDVVDPLFHQNSLLQLINVTLGKYNLYIRDITHFASSLGLFVQSD